MEPDEFYRLRDRLKLSQAKLARLLGVTVVAVWRWESGKEEGSKRKIPEPAARLLRLLAAHPSLTAEIVAPEPARTRQRKPSRRTRSGG